MQSSLIPAGVLLPHTNLYFSFLSSHVIIMALSLIRDKRIPCRLYNSGRVFYVPKYPQLFHASGNWKIKRVGAVILTFPTLFMSKLDYVIFYKKALLCFKNLFLYNGNVVLCSSFLCFISTGYTQIKTISNQWKLIITHSLNFSYLINI